MSFLTFVLGIVIVPSLDAVAVILDITEPCLTLSAEAKVGKKPITTTKETNKARIVDADKICFLVKVAIRDCHLQCV